MGRSAGPCDEGPPGRPAPGRARACDHHRSRRGPWRRRTAPPPPSAGRRRGRRRSPGPARTAGEPAPAAARRGTLHRGARGRGLQRLIAPRTSATRGSSSARRLALLPFGTTGVDSGSGGAGGSRLGGAGAGFRRRIAAAPVSGVEAKFIAWPAFMCPPPCAAPTFHSAAMTIPHRARPTPRPTATGVRVMACCRAGEASRFGRAVASGRTRGGRPLAG